MTKREKILQALLLSLSSNSLGCPVFRGRVESFNRDELPAIVIVPVGEQNQLYGAVTNRCVFTVQIHLHARASDSSTAVETQADPLVEALHAKVLSIGGVPGLTDVARVEHIYSDYEFEDGDGTALLFKSEYHFHYLRPVGEA
ncbi:hypothetical protein [Parvibium lacunae]|uniref:DUF3168 domain-containing protein n=1 Tax=Parvibium lacunae TaxID=1888893 RepID=A0A368L7S3_9BURK|nr:hypothetical protein [Parvibium lacunae]RCS59720.1 hypothetical protein DU000_03155 [Parvibium lacunae]